MAAPMSMSLVETVSSIYQFFEGTDNVVDENAVFQEPRIYRHDHKKCDICFPLIALGGCEASIPSALLFPEHKPFKIKIGLEKVKDLPSASASWALPIESCSRSQNTLCVAFNRKEVFRNSICNIICGGSPSGKLFGFKKVVYVLKDSVSENQAIADLTELRTTLAHNSICKVFTYLGYSVKTTCIDDPIGKDIRRLHVCHKQVCPQKKPEYSPVHCGAVLNSTTGLKDNSTSVEEYYREKKLAFEQMALARNNCQENVDQAASISEAEVTGELLWVKLHDNVSVSLLADSDENGVSRGATFLLYNQVRLSCIRRKFENEVENGVYPKLPGIEQIDFGVLNQNEEWELLLLILQFPYWLINCVSPRGKISLHPLLVGLDKLCRVFSVYYRRVRVLTDSRPQLLPVMYARLYLLQCVERILGLGLSVFDMKPLEFM